MNEAQWVTEYMESRGRNNNQSLALFWSLPLLLDKPATDLFVAQLALLPGPTLKEDFERLIPDYAKDYKYAIIATAINAVMQRRQEAEAKAKSLQSCLD